MIVPLGEYTAFYDRTVHGLRQQGWSRVEAESEALDRVEKQRQKDAVTMNPDRCPECLVKDGHTVECNDLQLRRMMEEEEAMKQRASKPPEEACVGDPCGILYAIGPDGRSAICDGELDCYVDVHGPVPGCTCHVSPPCHSCLTAPLACATCHETVP